MKKKYIFITLSILLISFIISCQKPRTEIESIEILPDKDSVLISAEEHLYSNPLLSRQLLKQAMVDWQATDSFSWYRLYNLYVKTFVVTSEMDSALLLSGRTEDYCSRKKDLSRSDYYLLADMNNCIGNIYATTSTNDSAIHYFQKTLRYIQMANDKPTEIMAYNNLADMFIRQGDFTQGTYYYRQALFIGESEEIPKEELINTYIGLGITYMELRDFDLSHHYYNLAYQLFDKMDMNRKFTYFTNQGNGYYYEGKYQEAFDQFKKGYELIESSPEYTYAQNISLINMGELYILLGKLDSAQYCLDKSYAYFQATQNNTVLYHTETLLFELALRKGNITEAKKFLDKHSDNNNFIEPNMISLRRKSLQHYYEMKGDYQNAYKFMRQYVQLEDSLRNDRVKMRVAEIDLRYKQDTTLMKQQLYIQEQQSDMNSLKLSVYIWILISVTLSVSVIFFYFYQKKKRAYLLAETRNKIISLRMENIRNRVSPHFIFNSLNQVVSCFKDNDSNKEIVNNLIKILRLNLRLTEKLYITLEEELNFIRTYLDMEKHRFQSSLSIDIQIDESIDTREMLLPAMMIQIPAENALKHGLRDKEGEKKLNIAIKDQDTDIMIRIEDNGVGFKVGIGQEDAGSTGTGLKVLNQTIMLLNSYNKKSISLYVRKYPHGTDIYPGCLIEIIIPKDYSYVLLGEKESV